MRDKQATWRPAPAAKPAHLVATTPDHSASHLAALRGATTAFTSKPTLTVPSVKSVRRYYDVPYGGKGDQRGIPREEDCGDVGSTKRTRSRSRGRYLRLDDAQLLGARNAVISANNSPLPSPLADFYRSPSIIAARLVSTSSSPVRGSTIPRSPNEVGTLVDRNVLQAEQVLQKSYVPNSKPWSQQAQESKKAVADNKVSMASIDLNRLPILAPVVSETSRNGGIRELSDREIKLKPPQERPSGAVDVPVSQSGIGTSLSTSMPEERRPVARTAQSANRLVPPVPAPRRGSSATNILRPSFTGPKSNETRAEAISRMADAMVASSLASSRPQSPTKPYRGHGLRRRSASVQDLHKLPSPIEVKPTAQLKAPKPMKQTLRKNSSEDEDDGTEITRRGRRHIVRKHPNMHHEGDRKRWRDKVTELERKRYEGVFAANRGLLLISNDVRLASSRVYDATSESNMVVNTVVRDIWERSRLPSHVLEQIYNLVAPEEPLLLNREQFVVGLWLIDQKLKGRKLPARVSQSVWGSVRYLHGIKLRKAT